MLNLYQLQMFLAVVDSGSFSLAAEYLHLTQPAVSEGVRALEQRLGTRLFERRGHRAMLTPDGTTFEAPARALLAQAAEAEQGLLRQRGVLSGTLRLATATAAGAPLLAGYLGQFGATHPAVRSTLVMREPAALLEGLRAGEFDVGFLAEQPRSTRVLVVPVAADEWLLVAPPGHVWGTGEGAAPVVAAGAAKRKRGRPPTRRTPDAAPRQLATLPLTHLRDQPLVLESADSIAGGLGRRDLRDLLEDGGLPWNGVHPICEVLTPIQVLRAVEAGAGVGVIRRSALDGYTGVAQAFHAEPPLLRPLVAVRDARVPPAAITTAWWEFLLARRPDAG